MCAGGGDREALPRCGVADGAAQPDELGESLRADSQTGVFVSIRQEKSSVFSPSGPSSRSTPGASSSVSALTSINSSSTPSVKRWPNLLSTHRMTGRPAASQA